MTRTGKIARLPKAMRDELNRRLADGEPGKRLADWLNKQPAVVTVLNADFGGRPISEQNLSEWKQGGFEDWCRHQESLESARRIIEEAKDYEDLADGSLLPDRFSELAAVTLARLLMETARQKEGPEKQRAVLGVVRELNQLRRSDRDWERAQREDVLHERDDDEYFEEKKRKAEAAMEFDITRIEIGYELARKKKAEAEAKGEPVPESLIQLLSTEVEFIENRRQWRKPFQPSSALAGAQENQTISK